MVLHSDARIKANRRDLREPISERIVLDSCSVELLVEAARFEEKFLPDCSTAWCKEAAFLRRPNVLLHMIEERAVLRREPDFWIGRLHVSSSIDCRERGLA